MIANWRRSPPARERCAPASVTNCEQLMTAKLSDTEFAASAPREQRVNNRGEYDQVDKTGRSDRENSRAAKSVTRRAGKYVLRDPKWPGVEVIESRDHPSRWMTRAIEPIDQDQCHAISNQDQKAWRN